MRNLFKIAFLSILGAIFMFSSCKSNKKICAAYNSYFVYDATNNGYYFTSFGADSTPGDRNSKRFNDHGLITKSRRRRDGSLENISTEELKAAMAVPDSSLMDDFDDSTGSILNVKELFPEKVNTDQEAYDHYVGEMLKKYQKEHPKEKAPFDSLAPIPKPKNMTEEEREEYKLKKKDLKERKKRARRRQMREQEEGTEEDDEEFDFEL